MKFSSAIPSLLALTLLPACTVSQKPQIGGFSSLIADPANALKKEPAPVRPNPHMDPIPEKFGAFTLRWTEDLEKTATNHEPDPDEINS
jgi:hypothetical protein